ncbi:MAG: hypothetical protein US31_C0023G0006 [Berkelbacteria bacterium GW2011_GWA1_36_9]|uniref:DUF3800 domain-containing protein n=1 Tax=Berkelbacteria bacterium GW2011_GWA1_36_9 TaxID=1618331 RepID=A0A0G0FT82_9BACT|nr:MAG: hypothetical protein US31_C0023G0006 [Berkelbacteria bacterium GW2011_GWA1_36_9]
MFRYNLGVKKKITQKLYCYVDETGQDTEGDIFIVVVIIVIKDKHEFENYLEKIENLTSKKKIKWSRLRVREKLFYLEKIVSSEEFEKNIYFQKFNNSMKYHDLTVLTIAQAINMFIKRNKIEEYQATITVDGLSKTEKFRMAKTIRNLGIKTRKIRGAKDESSSIIRLADMTAGFVRQTFSDKNYFKKIKAKYFNQINEI